MGKGKLLAFVLVGLALMLAGCEREVTGNVEAFNDISNENCFTCHNGFLDAAQGQWANSVHASGDNIWYTNRAGSDCMRCHDQEGFLYFLQNDSLPDEAFPVVSAIGCFTCHNPHENGNLSLRTEAPFTLLNGVVYDHGEGNLCVNCHHSRTDVRTIVDSISVNSRFGPHHGPQGDMINGTNGWEFPGEGYTFESSPHRIAVENTCVGCHMSEAEIHDGYMVGGHTWNMVDEATGTDLVEVCAECHEGAESYDVDGAQTEIEALLVQLGDELQNIGVFDSENTPVPDTIADANIAGAMFNYVMVVEDRSEGVHNFNYARSLLEASIDYVQTNPPGPTKPALLSSH